MRVFLRTQAARIRRRQILTNGASLIGQMLKVLIDLGDGEPALWTNAAMEDLIVEDGRVVGARISRDGSSLNIEARRGVLLAAGGFGHNADMRRRYSATRVFPADVGTCGGVITNEHAQVLDENDLVIDGLYATGNTTATVMGRTYPGTGASIANTMVFGYVAARHAAGRRVAGEKSR
jgi:aspartate oxidase